MAGKHTAGPWFTHEVKHGDHWVGNDEADIATVEGFGPDLADESAANARLIAAAPELLDGATDVCSWLRACLDCKEYPWDADQREVAEAACAYTVAAIARATQPLPPPNEEM